ncbi:bifunctional diguanylate cyclase/phosphodiesterase [Pararhodospirillum photometricum]|nr:bifunctional diguanylate cyclase/phosphodiesterase [Pararhodospirillum photometricum]
MLDSLWRFASSVAQAAETVDQIARLERLAYHDGALGLPNRHGFERMLDQRLQEPGPRPVLVFCAVEGVAVIAATFGATAATQVLRAVAGVLQGPPIGLDRLARFADDSLVGLAGPDGLDPPVLETLQTQPVPVEGGMAPVRLRVACVDPGSEVREASTLSRHGQAALLAAEGGKGGGTIRYTRAMNDGLYRRLRLRTALRRSLERDRGIDVHLQPQVDLARGTIIGAEALCRWFLDGHVVLPEEFIPLAETGGLSRALTGAVIQRVAEIGADRRALGRPALRLSVNLSAMDLSSDDFVETLLRDIEALGLTPDLLAFEITEAQILIHPRPVLDEVAKLRRAGFEVLLDDFGTGRASLSLLERLPVTAVKIDRTFVASLTVAGASRSLVATALAMARGLGLGVVAEGVETVEQHQALAALGCEVAQGFLYGAAVPVAEFERLVGGWSLARCLATAT